MALMDQKTIDTYNEMASEYDQETITFWEEFPRTFLDTFIQNTKGKVLDVGSGPGRDGLLLKDAGLDVVCLDASDAMIALSRERGLESVKGDFSNLPFEDSSFEGVWAYTSLLHIPKTHVPQAISEIHRVLKSDGVFGLGLIEGDQEEYRTSSGVRLPRWFSFYKKEEIENLLRNSGFKIEYFEQFKPKTKNYLNFMARK